MYEPTVISSSFDEGSKRYRCCCGCCHVRTCLYVIAFLNILYGLGVIYDTFREVIHGDRTIESMEPKNIDTGMKTTQMIIAVLLIIFSILLIIGMAKLKRVLVVPRMIWSIVTILFYATAAVLFVLTFQEVVQWNQAERLFLEIKKQGAGDDSTTFETICVAIFCGLCVVFMLIEVWILCCLVAVHRWIKDKLWYEFGGADAIPLKSTSYM